MNKEELAMVFDLIQDSRDKINELHKQLDAVKVNFCVYKGKQEQFIKKLIQCVRRIEAAKGKAAQDAAREEMQILLQGREFEGNL